MGTWNPLWFQKHLFVVPLNEPIKKPFKNGLGDYSKTNALKEGKLRGACPFVRLVKGKKC